MQVLGLGGIVERKEIKEQNRNAQASMEFEGLGCINRRKWMEERK